MAQSPGLSHCSDKCNFTLAFLDFIPFKSIGSADVTQEPNHDLFRRQFEAHNLDAHKPGAHFEDSLLRNRLI
jgi:hypothetical protein